MGTEEHNQNIIIAVWLIDSLTSESRTRLRVSRTGHKTDGWILLGR